MKKQTKLMIGGFVGILAISGGIYYFTSSPSASNQPTMASMAQPKIIQENGQTVKQFELTAEAKKLTLKQGSEVEAWTFNGTAPGPQIRVTQGDKVRVILKNNLSEPTSIHWHGLPVPNAMDGIPGVTQNAVKPGESFTYEFTATVPGTYWYHSHQNSVVQEDKGLYGSLVVEPQNPTVKYDKDVTLVLDEWMTGMDPSKMDMDNMSGMGNGQMNMGNGMSGMDHSQMNMGNGNMSNNTGASSKTGSGMSESEMMKQMYNVFTVNGAAGKMIQPVEVKPGERVKLRLVNAGFQTHLIHLHGQSFKITDTDGQPIQDPTPVTNQLVAIAPGERYDLEFTAPDKGFWIDDHADSPAAADIQIPVKVAGNNPEPLTATNEKLPVVDMTAYGKKTNVAERKYDKVFTMELDNPKDSSGKEIFTINGKTFPNTEPFTVQKGDWVKITMINRGTADHPMHLHGHFFRVLTKNGQPVQGSPLLKDTLNVRPGEQYEVEFLADNPGNWMFHCHDLHHASGGMVTEVKYEGFKPAFTPDPTVGNKPE